MKKKLLRRRELLGGACGIGLCSCAGLLFGQDSQNDSKTNQETDINELKRKNEEYKWREVHTKKQVAVLMKLIDSHLDENARKDILEKLGRNCAKDISARFKGNPDGFFEYMNKRFGEKAAYDKEHGVILMETPQRDCVCGLVDSKIMPSFFCSCSIGWQKEVYESLFGKKVDCELVESVLRGSKRCVFKNTVKE